ncbi:MAG TPA: hypothetical protein VI341_13690 [Actinomycetota bacterium]
MTTYMDLPHEPQKVIIYRCGDCGRDIEDVEENGRVVTRHVETWRDRADREKAEQKARDRAAQEARVAASPLYTGSAIKRCQASRSPSRGAPYRCGNDTGLRIFRTNKWSIERVFVACLGCVKADRGLYNGWGGDPNPVITPIEPELLEAIK